MLKKVSMKKLYLLIVSIATYNCMLSGQQLPIHNLWKFTDTLTYLWTEQPSHKRETLAEFAVCGTVFAFFGYTASSKIEKIFYSTMSSMFATGITVLICYEHSYLKRENLFRIRHANPPNNLSNYKNSGV